LPTIPGLSLFLHALNALLIYSFIATTFRNLLLALAAMLLWGLHPLHADSVAWIIRQNSLSHTICYMLALLSYVLYLRGENRQKKKIFYGLALITFVGAAFFQKMALVIPMAFFLLDYFENRIKVKNEWWLDKLPFVGLAILSWFISINATPPDYAEEALIPLGQKVSLGGYALWVYLSKIFAPLELTLINPSHIDASVTALGAVSVFATLMVLALFAVFIFRKKVFLNKGFTIGILFFLLHLSPALVLPIDGYLLWIAYKSYIPYLGIVISMISLYQFLFSNRQLWLGGALILLLSSALGYLAWQRSNDWKSTQVLLTQVIKKYPRYPIPYFLRGNLYLRDKHYAQAKSDFETVNSLRPDILSTFLLGHIFHKLRDYKTSIVAYEKVAGAQPALANTFRYLVDMGLNKANLFDPNTANQFLKKAEPLANTPELRAELHLAYGIYYSVYGIYDKSLEKYQEAIKQNPQYVDAYINLGTLTLLYSKKIDEAINYLKKAEMLAPTDSIVLGNLANCYAKKKDTITANYYAERYKQLVGKKD
jgi:protein O-mannosyl-transferase